jgi:hypothetical protein
MLKVGKEFKSEQYSNKLTKTVWECTYHGIAFGTTRRMIVLKTIKGPSRETPLRGVSNKEQITDRRDFDTAYFPTIIFSAHPSTPSIAALHR